MKRVATNCLTNVLVGGLIAASAVGWFCNVRRKTDEVLGGQDRLKSGHFDLPTSASLLFPPTRIAKTSCRTHFCRQLKFGSLHPALACLSRTFCPVLPFFEGARQ
jgi:hypothetical protein